MERGYTWVEGKVIFTFNLKEGAASEQSRARLSWKHLRHHRIRRQHAFGVVYELSPTKNGWEQRVLHEFAGGKDEATQWDGVVIGLGGKLFGRSGRWQQRYR